MSSDQCQDRSSTMDSLDYWQVTKHTVTQRDKYILETGQLSDCNILVGEGPQEQILKVHKLILAKASRVFEAMFYGEMAETNDTIVINDVQPETFKALLEYIYTDVVNVRSFELACELCYCAKKYMFPFLIEECTKFILADLSPKTACRAYEFAKLFERPVLSEKCLEFIRMQTKSVLEDPSFEVVELETMLTIFEQEELNIDSEIELLSAAERWARSECIRKGLDPENSKLLRSVIGNALSKIRFLTVTPQEFAEGSVGSLLLDQNEVTSILRNVSVIDKKWPMPEGLSNNLQSRACLPKQEPTKKDLSVAGRDILRYCQRDPMETNIKKYNISNISVSALAFKVDVDRNTRIIGIKVPSQVDFVGCTSRYTEKLFFELLDTAGSRLTSGTFEESIFRHRVLTLMFDVPIDIKKDTVYRIEIVFMSDGSYPIVPCRDEVLCGSALFSFGYKETNFRASYADLIRSIIFTID